MKTMGSLLVLVSCLVFAGCRGPVEEVKSFLNEKDDVFLHMAKKLEANPSEAGVHEARQIFEARKHNLQAKSEALRQKHLEKYGDLTSMMLTSASNYNKFFNDRSVKFAVACLQAYSSAQCDPAQEKLSALEKDFKEAVK